jgi:hypothetical protein
MMPQDGVKLNAMNSDISTVENESMTAADKRPYPDRSYETQQKRTILVAGLLERGIRTTAALARELKTAGYDVSRPTIIETRNRAMDLIAEETKPMNRTHLRNLEIGRLNYWIENLTERINALDWEVIDDNGTPAAFDMFNKMLQRLKDMGDQLHKITGLNTEVSVNIEEKRRIVFIRPQATDATQSTEPIISNHNNDHIISEGEIISQ